MIRSTGYGPIKILKKKFRMRSRNFELLGVAVVLFLVGFSILQPSIRGNDGFGNYVYIASILKSGNLDFSDNYRAYDEIHDYPFKLADLPVYPKTGLPTNRYGIGASIFWSPFLVPFHYTLKFINPHSADTLGRPYEWAVGIGTVFWGSLGLWLLYRRLRHDAPRWTCLLALFGIIFGTPLGFYLYAHGSMSHGISFFLAVWLLLLFERAWHQPDLKFMALCGFTMSLLVMTRFQDITWSVVIGIALTVRIFMRETEKTRSDNDKSNRGRINNYRPSLGLLCMVLTGLLTFLPQMFTWRVLYGSMIAGPTPYLEGSAGSLSYWPYHLIAVLVSEKGGVIAWHPLYALAMAGSALSFFKKDSYRVIALVGLIGFAAQLYLVSCWSVWWAGASFGNRFFISSLPFLLFGLATLFVWLNKFVNRNAIAVGITLLVIWNMGLLLQYAIQMVPREDEIPWSQVVKQNLFDIPYYIWEKLYDIFF
jgi:hypothetical protein